MLKNLRAFIRYWQTGAMEEIDCRRIAEALVAGRRHAILIDRALSQHNSFGWPFMKGLYAGDILGDFGGTMWRLPLILVSPKRWFLRRFLGIKSPSAMFLQLSQEDAADQRDLERSWIEYQRSLPPEERLTRDKALSFYFGDDDEEE